MLSQKINAIIVAIGRSNDRMHMKLQRFSVGQEQSWVMVKLDESDMALYAVIEWIIRAVAAYPAKMRRIKVLFKLGHLCLARTVWHLAYKSFYQVKKRRF